MLKNNGYNFQDNIKQLLICKPVYSKFSNSANFGSKNVSHCLKYTPFKVASIETCVPGTLLGISI